MPSSAAVDALAVALIAALSCAATVACERLARELIFAKPAFAAAVEEQRDLARKRAAVAASAARAAAAGKARDAAALERAARAMGPAAVNASFAVAVHSMRGAALRGALPRLALWLLAAVWPAAAAAALPVAVPWPLSLASHAGVAGDDAREVSVAFLWLLAGAVAQRVLVPALLPPPPAGEVSTLAFIADVVAEQQVGMQDAPRAAPAGGKAA